MFFSARGQSTVNTKVDRHPLEIEALTSPAAALKKIAAAREALPSNNYVELARLALAEANACRVTADWLCQRRAATAAMTAADKTQSIYLQVRARISLGRSLSSMRDYSAAARTLAQAQQRLGTAELPELRADILLAYSSVSHSLGKLSEAIRYAQEGLDYAPAETMPDLRLRLLRNLSRNLSDTGEPLQAKQFLVQADALLPRINDPKLSAEISLEQARNARRLNDASTVALMGKRIDAIAGKLQNTQLQGLALETQAQALAMQGERRAALALMQRAHDQFAQLDLYRDELRTMRDIVDLQLLLPPPQPLGQSIKRLNKLQDDVARIERESASSDFEERFRYAQSDAEVAVANAKTENERLRAEGSESALRLTLIAGLFAIFALLAAVGMYWQQRRYAKRMLSRSREMERVLMQTSHDLRSPLSGILGMSDLLLASPQPVEQQEKIRVIRDAGASLHALAQDLLDRGRIEGGKLNLHPVATDLGHLANSLGALYQSQAAKKKLSFDVVLGENLPKYVLLDADRIRQVIGNLVGNALKFCESGSITLTLTRADVPIENGFAVIRFQVRDTGPGISKEEIERLFMPFAKGKQGERHSSGAGLGLSIANSLVKLMGSQISVSSTLNKGATFHFELRLPIVDAPPVVVDHALTVEPSSQLRVLAVDDDPINLMLLSFQIARLGHSVEQCASAVEALALVKTNESQFDVVIHDYEMPDMNGPELATALRAVYADRGFTPRLIMLSAHVANSVAGGDTVDAWLVKPVSSDQLRRALDKRIWESKQITR